MMLESCEAFLVLYHQRRNIYKAIFRKCLRPYHLFCVMYSYEVGNTRKLCYRKDDRAMHPTYGCPETFRDSLTTPTALFPRFSWAFVPINPMNVPTKFEVRSFTRSRDRGYRKNLGRPWIRPRSLFSENFNELLFG